MIEKTRLTLTSGFDKVRDMTAKQTGKPKCKHAQSLGRMAKGKPKRFTEAYIVQLTERLAGARAKRAEKLAKGRAI